MGEQEGLLSGRHAYLALEGGRVCVLVLLVSHSKEDGSGEVAARLGQAEAKDAVDAVKVCVVPGRR